MGLTFARLWAFLWTAREMREEFRVPYLCLCLRLRPLCSCSSETCRGRYARVSDFFESFVLCTLSVDDDVARAMTLIRRLRSMCFLLGCHRTLAGLPLSSPQTITLDVTAHDTVLSVKSKVFEKERLPVNEQRLLFRGKELGMNAQTRAFRA